LPFERAEYELQLAPVHADAIPVRPLDMMNSDVLPTTSSAVSTPVAELIHTIPRFPFEPAHDWRIASKPRPAGAQASTLQKALCYVTAGANLPLASTGRASR
jgi:hypothetical protein